MLKVKIDEARIDYILVFLRLAKQQFATVATKNILGVVVCALLEELEMQIVAKQYKHPKKYTLAIKVAHAGALMAANATRCLPSEHPLLLTTINTLMFDCEQFLINNQKFYD